MARLSLPTIGGFEFGEPDAAGDVPWRLEVAKLDVPHPVRPHGSRPGRALVLTSDAVARFGIGMQSRPVRINARADDHWDSPEQQAAGVRARAYGYATHSAVEAKPDGRYWVLSGYLWRHENPRVTDYVLANKDLLGGSYELGRTVMRADGETDYIEEFVPQGVAILRKDAAAFRGLTQLYASEGEMGDECAPGGCDICHGEGDCPLGDECPAAGLGDEQMPPMDAAKCKAEMEGAGPGELAKPDWLRKKIADDEEAEAKSVAGSADPGGDAGPDDPRQAGDSPKGEPMDENTMQLLASQAAEIGALKEKLAAAEVQASQLAAAAEAGRGELLAAAEAEKTALESKLTGDLELLAARVVELEGKLTERDELLAAAAEKTAELEADKLASQLDASGDEGVRAVCLKLAKGEAITPDEGLLLASAKRGEGETVVVPEIGASGAVERVDRIDALIAAKRAAAAEKSPGKMWATVDAVAAKGA